MVVFDVLYHATEGLKVALSRVQKVVVKISDVLGHWVRGLPVSLLLSDGLDTSQQKVPSHLSDDILRSVNRCGDQVGKNELVCLEESSGHILVNVLRDHLNQAVQSSLQVVTLGRHVNGLIEEYLDELERVLVHIIDVGEVSNDEVQDAASLGDGGIHATSLIDLLLYNLSSGHTLIDFLGGDFGVRQDVDEGVCVQDFLHLILTQEFEDVVLNGLEGLLISVHGNDDVKSLLFDLWLLLDDDIS